jgi:hypothetical protein
VRFLSVSPYGAVLEALGKLDYAMVPFEIPVGKSKGKYVRIAGPNDKEHLVANFECSINLDKVRLAMCHIARCMPPPSYAGPAFERRGGVLHANPPKCFSLI